MLQDIRELTSLEMNHVFGGSRIRSEGTNTAGTTNSLSDDGGGGIWTMVEAGWCGTQLVRQK